MLECQIYCFNTNVTGTRQMFTMYVIDRFTFLDGSVTINPRWPNRSQILT